MATQSEQQSRERSLSQPADALMTNALKKQRHSIATAGHTVSNVLKIAKVFVPEDNSSSEESKSPFKMLAARRMSSVLDNKSDKTSSSGGMGNFRRRSTFKGLANSISTMMKLRMLTSFKPEPQKPKIRYENTYRMAPDSGKHIAISKTEAEAKKVLDEMIGEKPYDQRRSGDLAVKISNKIKDKIKALNFLRYRIIVQVVISQTSGQGLEVASRCVWDASADNYSCVTYSNDTTTATVLIYGVYLE